MPSGGGRKELHSGETGAQRGQGVVRVGLGEDDEGPTKVGRYWKGAQGWAWLRWPWRAAVACSREGEAAAPYIGKRRTQLRR
jgi:hypothetical protein